MFHSNTPYRPSSTTGLFGSQSVFGQTNGISTNPLDSSTRSSPFCGAGVFGHSSVPAFDTPTALAAGTVSTPAFGLGSSPSQTTPPFYGSNIFGLTTPLIAFSQPVFSLAPLLCVPQSPVFFVSLQPMHWGLQLQQHVVPLFPHHLGFQQINNPVVLDQHLECQVPHHLDPQVTLVFGGQSASAFGSSNTQAFGAHNTARSALSTTPILGASSAPCLGFGYIPSFVQYMPAVGSNPFGTIPAPFGTQRSTSDNQKAIPVGSPVFGASSFRAKQGGSRVAAYTPTPETNGANIERVVAHLESISAMPVYKDRSHEELRWEDYQHGDTAGANSSGQAAGGVHNTSRPGLSTAPGFSASTAPCLGSGYKPCSGQSISAVGSNPFGIIPEPFGNQECTIGNQKEIPVSSSVFRQSSFGAKQGGSRVTSYTPTPEAVGSSVEGFITQMESISAMPMYEDKSHEELRWEDYQRGDRGGLNSAGQPASGLSSVASSQFNTFGSVSSKLSKPSTSGVSCSPSSGFNSILSASSLNPFSLICSSTPTLAVSSASASILCSPPFDGSTRPGCSSSPPMVGSSMVDSSSIFSSQNIGDTQSSGLSQSTSSIGHEPSTSGPCSSPLLGRSNPLVFNSSSSTFGSSMVGSGLALGSSPTLGDIQPSGVLQPSATSTKQTPFSFGLTGFSPFSGYTAPAFTSPSIFGSSVLGSNSTFSSSFATGNIQTSGLSQASTVSFGKIAPALGSSSSSSFGALTSPAFDYLSLISGSSTVASSSTVFGSSLTCDNSRAGLSEFSNPSTGQTQSPFGLHSSLLSGSRPVAFSSASVFSFSPVESSLGFGLSSTLGYGNTQSTGLFQSSTPAFMQTSSPFRLSSSASSLPAFSSSHSIFSSSLVGSSSPCSSSMTHGNPQSSGLLQSAPFIGQTSPFGETAQEKRTSPFSFSFETVLLDRSTNNPVVCYQTTPSLSVSSHPAAPVQTSSAFPDGGIVSCGSGSTSNHHGQVTSCQPSSRGSQEEAGMPAENPEDRSAHNQEESSIDVLKG